MWILLSFLTSLCITILILSYRYLTTNGLSISILLLYFFTFSLPMYCFDVYRSGDSLKIKLSHLLFIVFLAFIGCISNILHLNAIKLAPNPGYCDGIIAGKIIYISLLSWLMLDSSLDLRKIIGCLIIIIGMVVVVI